MTQEEKQLLLQDISARLPCGIKFSWKDDKDYNIFTLEDIGSIMKYAIVEEGKILPYLRPMSSMTEEEKEELRQEHIKDEKLFAECLTKAANGDSSMRGKVVPHFAADWCNKHHFDYRGLIPMGLALEAPKDMYVFKN